MMEGWKKWYIVIAVVFIVTAIAGKIIRTQAPDTGLAEVGQLEDLLSLPVELEYALGDNGSKDVVVKDLTQNQESYVRQAEEADIIVLAESTENLQFTTGTYGQEIRVSSVIKGSEWIDQNEKCWVWRNYGMEVMDGKIVYRNVLNLMQTGSYLVFLKRNQLNEYRAEKEFQTASEYFGYLQIPESKAQPIKQNQRNTLYKEWSELSIFTVSEEIADAWNQIAEILIQKFAKIEG